jgi:signal-transduction protein with cAMP-binding, CBS, and nucleotidyltransferase domain
LELSYPAGHVVVDVDNPMSGLLLVLQGVLIVESPSGEDERGPGNLIGQWERLDGSDDVRVVAESDVRLVAVDRAAWEAAQTG